MVIFARRIPMIVTVCSLFLLTCCSNKKKDVLKEVKSAAEMTEIRNRGSSKKKDVLKEVKELCDATIHFKWNKNSNRKGEQGKKFISMLTKSATTEKIKEIISTLQYVDPGERYVFFKAGLAELGIKKFDCKSLKRLLEEPCLLKPTPASLDFSKGSSNNPYAQCKW